MQYKQRLIELGLSRYAPVFEVHEVDGQVLPLLTLEDLKDMAINVVGSRRKLYSAILKLGKGFSLAITLLIMAEVRRGGNTWTEELASLVEDTGVLYGESMGIPAPALRKYISDEEVVKTESLKEQVTEFLNVRRFCSRVL